MKFPKVKLRSTKMASPPVVQGGGVMPRSVDFLVAEGCLRVQACGGLAAGFAGAASCSVEMKPESSEDLVVISFCVWTFL